MSILRADSIRDRAGTGAPDFPNGLTGNLTGTATTATTLSGTPNITVGTVTGTDATFSGNLTVNGTTTTIDTTVTAVDSLAVDGNITALGRLGIGTDNTLTTKLHVQGTGNGSSGSSSLSDSSEASAVLLKPLSESGTAMALGARDSGGHYIQGLYAASSVVSLRDISINPYGGSVGIGTLSDNFGGAPGASTVKIATSGVERLRITSGGTAIFKAGLAEKNVNGTTLAAASNNIALSSGNVHRFTGDESGAKTVNFTGVHSTLGSGESVSFTVILTPNNSGYINAATVDGATPGTPTKWSGGSAPSSGSNGGRDVYTFTIFKYGTATTDYEVYGAVTNYA